MIEMTPFLFAFFTSLLTAALIVVTRTSHGSVTSSSNETRAVQAAHFHPTPRIGGVALFIGLLAACFALDPERSTLLKSLVFAAIPVFVMGLIEDTYRHVSPRLRYLSAVLSTALAIYLLDVMIVSPDLIGLYWLFEFPAVCCVFTLFVVASYCHAFNLIDGLNGLATGVGLIASVGLGIVALQTGQQDIASICLVMFCALLGFLGFNFPHGKIFLGDSGAYLIGFVLTFSAIILLFRVPEVSAWSMFLIFFWPLADTLLAMSRRFASGRSIGLADKFHFHQLVMRSLEILVLGRGRRAISNPVATAVMMPMVAMPAAAGVLLWNNTLMSFLVLIFFGALFAMTFRLAFVLTSAKRTKTRAFAKSIAGRMGATRADTEKGDSEHANKEYGMR